MAHTTDARLEGAVGKGLEKRLQDRTGYTITAPDGQWEQREWFTTADNKRRPIEPSTYPLVDGPPARVGRMRAYGNAIVAPLAATFIRAVMDVI